MGNGRSAMTVGVLAGLVAAGASLAHAQATVEPAAYDVVILSNVMVPMRDGVRLATDVYLPARNGRPEGGRPAILERTPYNKDDVANGWPRYFVPRGYVAAVQDVRGRYRSEGRWRPLRDDGPDGADLAAWIGRQAWANGRIGTVGTSYAGGTQHAMAIADAPHLAAMVPVDAMSNAGRYGIRHNGAFELRWLNWVLTLGNATGARAGAAGVASGAGPNARAAARRAASPPAAAGALEELGLRVRDFVTALPLRAGATPLRFAPDYEEWLVEAMRHGNADAYWSDMGSSVVDHLAEYKDVPVYHVTGWYDSWGTPVANLSYVELSRAKRGPHRLIVGPWTHGGQQVTFSGDAEFGRDTAVDMNAFRERWFERWLKGADNGVERGAAVRIFVMGGGDAHRTPEGRVFVGGHWRDEGEWPLARTSVTPYYLHADGQLLPRAPRASPPTTYSFDPRHPVPTIGGNVSSEGDLMLRGARDQRCRPEVFGCTDTLPLATRRDVLVFESPVLEEDVEVTGRLVVKLWASSSAVDTDFTAKLVDVYPPSADFPAGVALNVADSIVRGRYRESLVAERPMTPGTAYELTIEMYPTSLVFARGHRIRLDVSSSNFPRFDVNPNTGERLGQHRRLVVAENTVYHDPAHPSRILLPVIPPAR
jgi:putative CocE/NonD family hydrolase